MASQSENEAGLRALAAIRRHMQIDDQWSTRERRGFTWWGHRFAQSVRADPPVEDHGLYASRVLAETMIATDVPSSPDTFKHLSAFNDAGALMHGYVLDEQRAAVSLVSSGKVYDAPEGDAEAFTRGVAHVLSVAFSLQAAEAHRVGDTVARLLNGTPAVSCHPVSGPRLEPDGLLEMTRWCAEKGAAPSVWTGDEMQASLELLERWRIFALGDGGRVCAEVPFHGSTALIAMDATLKHPVLGNGLHVRLELPLNLGVDDTHVVAARLNGLDLAGEPLVPFLGGWCSGLRGDTLTYVSFYPNVDFLPGLVRNVAGALVMRARWAGESAFEDPRPPGQQWRVRTVLEQLSGGVSSDN